MDPRLPTRMIWKERMSRIYLTFVCLTLAMIVFLVLLRFDGLSSVIVICVGLVTLGITAITFRSAVQNGNPTSRARKIFEWSSGLSCLVLALFYFLFDSAK